MSYMGITSIKKAPQRGAFFISDARGLVVCFNLGLAVLGLYFQFLTIGCFNLGLGFFGAGAGSSGCTGSGACFRACSACSG